MITRYWRQEMAGLKLTRRGEIVANVFWYVGTAAVMLGCIAAGWMFLTVVAS